MKLTHIARTGALSLLVACTAVGLASAGQDSGKAQSGASTGMQSSSQSKKAMSQQQNAAVKQVQQALQEKGYEVGAIDGKWGKQSTRALKQYQRDNNIAATGNLNRQTADRLGLSTGEFARFEEQSGQAIGSQEQGRSTLQQDVEDWPSSHDVPDPHEVDP